MMLRTTGWEEREDTEVRIQWSSLIPLAIKKHLQSISPDITVFYKQPHLVWSRWQLLGSEDSAGQYQLSKRRMNPNCALTLLCAYYKTLGLCKFQRKHCGKNKAVCIQYMDCYHSCALGFEWVCVSNSEKQIHGKTSLNRCLAHPAKLN